MIDHAQNLIISELTNHASRSILLVADEHPLDRTHWSYLLSLKELTLISNRYNQIQDAIQFNLAAQFNDFLIHPNHDVIAFRISKEKFINHHILKSAAESLNDNGTLIIAGAKKEGIRTLIKEAEKYFGSTATIIKGPSQISMALVSKTNIDDNHIPKQADQYHQMQVIEHINELPIYSKPGQFSWNRIDKGSQVLMDVLETIITETNTPLGDVLDLGCGYGYLGLRAASMNPASITLTDNCAAAVACAEYNATEFFPSVKTHIFPSHIDDAINELFDTILCNPPYHLGFSTDTDITDEFIAACQRLLKPEGCAYFVVNQFIPIERMAKTHQLQWQQIEKYQSFKIGRLRLSVQ